MTARALAVALALAGAALCRASGDSGDLLATPFLKDGSPNRDAATIQLGKGSDPKTAAERDGWHSAAGGTCYARKTGVALGRKGGGILRRDLPEPERVGAVTVTCGAETESHRDQEATLVLALDETGEAWTRTFRTPAEAAGETEVSFILDPTVEATKIELRSGPDCGTIFEVRRVRWDAAPPPITPDADVPGIVAANETFTCSLVGATGGTGRYVRAEWAFQGETRVAEAAPDAEGTLDLAALKCPVSFTAPRYVGDYPLTLTVTDDAGAVGERVYVIRVSEFAPPTAITVSAITRTGFAVSWEAGRTGLAPIRTDLAVRDVRDARPVSAEIALTDWTQEDDARWALAGPIDLMPWTEGVALAAGAVLEIPGWGGSAEYALGDGAWRPLLTLGGGLFGGLSVRAGETALRLRVAADEAAGPPTLARLSATLSAPLATVTHSADGQRRDHTFAGLPAAATLSLQISLVYRDSEGTLVAVAADPVEVRLLPVPPIAGWRLAEASRILTLTWPEGARADGLTVALDFRAECDVAHDLPPGLYLTRVCHHAANASRGTGKAIALTNTSDAPIALDGNTYSLLLTRASGTQATWDFHLLADDGDWVYPLVVPAHGERVLANRSSPILDLREEAVPCPSVPPLNFAAGATLTLLRDGAPVTVGGAENAIVAAGNAVSRLPADALAAPLTLAIADAATTLPALYAPWVAFRETRTLSSQTLPSPDASRVRYGEILDALPASARRAWVEVTVLQGDARSEPVVIDLWARPDAAPRPGFRLRLR